MTALEINYKITGGVILKKYEFVKELIENTSTSAGLKVSADISKKIYKTGRKYADNFKVTMSIISDTISRTMEL
ncbi:hypothetical protein QUF90_10290 [Desulfococcaceae bacterium HSG9]|nr:hypothetical protein [Desulfococcaceae bacterium HSG9]